MQDLDAVEAHLGGAVDARFDLRFLPFEVPEGIGGDANSVGSHKTANRWNALRSSAVSERRFATCGVGERPCRSSRKLPDSNLGMLPGRESGRWLRCSFRT